MTPSLTEKGSTLDAQMAGRRKPFGHLRFPPNGWSIYGAQRAQPAATGRKWDALENRSNKPIRNRWQPTATVSERMVRRGSTVRVRQRALCKSPARRRFCDGVHDPLQREGGRPLPEHQPRVVATASERTRRGRKLDRPYNVELRNECGDSLRPGCDESTGGYC
jgi:hypothetical protein